MSTRIPVYHHLDYGIYYFPHLKANVYGKFVQAEPTYIPVELFLAHRSMFKLAPLTRAYLTELFGPQHFDRVKLDIENIYIYSPDFIRRLSDKVGLDRSRLFHPSTMATKVRNLIMRRMGIYEPTTTTPNS